jgi:hypothetical protein
MYADGLRDISRFKLSSFKLRPVTEDTSRRTDGPRWPVLGWRWPMMITCLYVRKAEDHLETDHGSSPIEFEKLRSNRIARSLLWEKETKQEQLGESCQVAHRTSQTRIYTHTHPFPLSRALTQGIFYVQRKHALEHTTILHTTPSSIWQR